MAESRVVLLVVSWVEHSAVAKVGSSVVSTAAWMVGSSVDKKVECLALSRVARMVGD
jgi:hypothetical protein